MSKELNIDTVVGHIGVLQQFQSELINILRQAYDYTHWKSPIKSLLAFFVSCLLCLIAEHFLAAAFIAIPVVLLLGYVKSKAYSLRLKIEGERSKPLRLKNVQLQFLEGCNDDVRNSRKRLNEFRILVGHAHETTKTLIYMGEEIRALFYWKHPRWSLAYFSIGIVGFLGHLFVSWRIPLLFLVIWLFTRNGKMVERLRGVEEEKKPTDADSLAGEANPGYLDREESPKSDDDEEINEDALLRSHLQIHDSDEGSEAEAVAEEESAIATEPRKMSGLSRFLRKRKQNKSALSLVLRCFQCNVKLPGSHMNCPHCGETFCSNCCKSSVTKAHFGATAPGADVEEVSVCRKCFMILQRR